MNSVQKAGWLAYAVVLKYGFWFISLNSISSVCIQRMQFSGVHPIVFSQLHKYTLFCLCITECRQHSKDIGYLLKVANNNVM